MGLAVWALATYIAVIILWSTWLKRGIAEAMVIGFVAVCLFGKGDFLGIAVGGMSSAFQEQVVFSALAFTFIGFLLSKTGIIDLQVAMLNSMMGRLPGGAGYVATIGAALFGSVAHAGSANAATIGTVTIPWMKKSQWPAEVSATVVAGNSGLGNVIPPSGSFFILVGLGTVAPFVTVEKLLLTMYAVSAWCLLWRLIMVFMFVRKHKIGRDGNDDIQPLRHTLSQGWWTMLIFIAIAIPICLTLGPVSEMLSAALGSGNMKSISLMIWMPVMLGIFALLMGWRKLPKTFKGWHQLIASTAPRYREVGTTLVFAFAGGASLGLLGLGEQLSDLLQGMNASPLTACFIVVVLVILVAGPLSSTATVATIGGIGFSVLMYAGVNPYLAAALVLIAASTEGASPPGSASIYIASGIAQVPPARTFIPLIVYYVVPFIFIGVGVGMGWLPVPA
ncbi:MULTISPECIES: TRAP transporter large permease subunit [Pseudomonas]|uniref:TRAP transporter large permease subunit n=1 Tax=Pseudomonas taiwanensis TaxID=470150 RepID=A0ABR6V5N5_9PSED|nr:MULTISPECIES: TRAP transporter large permease subunit [Pseudomonas]MBC3475815.1 TRAP transporter large permease subunit [Pseudomonas taiwanensis]BDM22291.1 TRAP transporter large permease [Pseudomonas sp. LRP2-20]